MNQIIDAIKKRKALSFLIFILLFLLFTNPSNTSFKNYLGLTSNEGLKKEMNFFIFSVFSYSSYHYKNEAAEFHLINEKQELHREVYFGIAANFFKYELKANNIEQTETSDSTIVVNPDTSLSDSDRN